MAVGDLLRVNRTGKDDGRPIILSLQVNFLRLNCWPFHSKVLPYSRPRFLLLYDEREPNESTKLLLLPPPPPPSYSRCHYCKWTLSTPLSTTIYDDSFFIESISKRVAAFSSHIFAPLPLSAASERAISLPRRQLGRLLSFNFPFFLRRYRVL